MKARTRMLQIIKMQFLPYAPQKGFQVAFTVIAFYCMASFIVAVYKNLNSDVSSMNCAFTFCANNDSAPFFNYFKMLFPFLVVFPLAFSSMTDRLNQTTTYIFTRCSQSILCIIVYQRISWRIYCPVYPVIFKPVSCLTCVSAFRRICFGEPYSKGFVEGSI